jgi:Putative zinc-finger
MRLKRTCKEVTELVIAREDRALPLSDRLAMRVHMSICTSCPKFERQIFMMRDVMKPWRNYEYEPESVDGPVKG